MLPSLPARPVLRRAYSVAEVSLLLGIPLRTAYLWVQNGVVPSVRVGRRRILVPAEAIDELLGVPGVGNTGGIAPASSGPNEEAAGAGTPAAEGEAA